jgi:UDP-N-acetylglucosamine--dolichyl-phosphate N-acetylglucosaminephosphotransferase
MIALKLLIVFGISFGTAFFSAPRFIEKLRENGFVVKDMYKADQPSVPTMGGLIILSGVLASLIVAQLLFSNPADEILIFYFIVFTYGIFGLIDDLIDVGRRLKIFLPFFLALPIALLNIDTSLWIVFTQIELGLFYTFIIAPVYVMVVANLINMHSGYNGLAPGLSTLLLLTVGIGGYVQNGAGSLLFVLPILGASMAFLVYNKYPSRVFDGNSGSLMLGASLGGLIVLNNLEIFGVVILVPHIINFLMYVTLKLKRMKEVKFGSIREDGTLKVPHPVCLKWTLPYYFRLTEQNSTNLMIILTLLFCLMGISVVF